MTKPRRRRRGNAQPQDPDRQPANLDHRKGHNSYLRAGLPEFARVGRPAPRYGPRRDR